MDTQSRFWGVQCKEGDPRGGFWSSLFQVTDWKDLEIGISFCRRSKGCGQERDDRRGGAWRAYLRKCGGSKPKASAHAVKRERKFFLRLLYL